VIVQAGHFQIFGKILSRLKKFAIIPITICEHSSICRRISCLPGFSVARLRLLWDFAISNSRVNPTQRDFNRITVEANHISLLQLLTLSFKTWNRNSPNMRIPHGTDLGTIVMK